MTAPSIEAVSFDFYQTLAFHREGRGRGAGVMAYLGAAGFEAGPWEHQILYDIFDRHLLDYDPLAPDSARTAYHQRLAKHLLDRLSVRGADPVDHATALWQNLGPASLSLFPETLDVLARIRRAGLPMIIISNWQNGLRHFCSELGIAGFFEEILVSAEEGFQKPDVRIFERACAVIAKHPENVIHVGDSIVDDVEGGEAAGLQVALIARDGLENARGVPLLSSLRELPPMIGIH